MKKKGFTLIELLVVIAIIGIVMATAGNFMPFGFRVNKKASSAFDMQNAARLVSSRINDICRDRENAVLLSTVPASMGSYKYIYMKPGNTNTIFYYNGTNENVLSQLDGGTFAISFTSSGTVLNYTITAQNGSSSYQLTGAVELVNMKSAISGSSGSIVKMDI